MTIMLQNNIIQNSIMNIAAQILCEAISAIHFSIIFKIEGENSILAITFCEQIPKLSTQWVFHTNACSAIDLESYDV